MKKFALSIAFAGLFAIAGTASAVVNAPVSIAYPISGSSVANYFKSSFTTTCPGGSNVVNWYLDSTLVGSGSYYDTASVEFLHKLPTGWHTLTVKASCGGDAVKFYVQ